MDPGERPQNKPEGKQAVSQMQSGPPALSECSGPSYISSWVLGDSVYIGELKESFLQRDSPPGSSTSMNCIVRPQEGSSCPMPAPLPTVPIATCSASIRHEIPNVKVTPLASIGQGRPLLPEGKCYLRQT